MSTTADQFIQIPGSAIEEVRKAVLSDLGTAADRLRDSIDGYLSEPAGDGRDVVKSDYYEAYETVQRCQALIDDLGDDLNVHEDLDRIPGKHRDVLAGAAAYRAGVLRQQLGEGDRSTAELRAILDIVDVLDDLAGVQTR